MKRTLAVILLSAPFVLAVKCPDDGKHMVWEGTCALLVSPPKEFEVPKSSAPAVSTPPCEGEACSDTGKKP